MGTFGLGRNKNSGQKGINRKGGLGGRKNGEPQKVGIIRYENYGQKAEVKWQTFGAFAT